MLLIRLNLPSGFLCFNYLILVCVNNEFDQRFHFFFFIITAPN